MFELSYGRLAGNMLPDSNNMPPSGDERVIRGAVALYSPQELWAPVGSVDRRVPEVLGTRMPKTSIYEYGDTTSCENDVRPHGAASDNEPMVFSESVSLAVKTRANGNLGRRVGSFDGLHISRSTRGWRRLANDIDNIFWRHGGLEFLSRPSGDKMLIVKFFTPCANLEKQA